MIYTEEMKREIESHGIMVIEFKMMLKKGTAAITIIANKLALVFENIVGAIRELSNKFIELVEERIIPIFKPTAEKLCKRFMIVETKHQFIKNIKSKYRLIIKRHILIHCRNNC